MARNEAIFMDVTCLQTKKLFHARYDFAADDKWVLTYGVSDEKYRSMISASKSGGSVKTIDISEARTGPQYKCPYCGNTGYVRCGRCKKLTCYEDGLFTCASCGNTGEVSGTIDSLEGSKGAAQ